MEKVFPCRVQAGYGLTETAPSPLPRASKSTVTYTDEDDRLRHLASTSVRT